MNTDNCNGWKNRVFPFRCWLGELKKPETLRADLIAGITVALVLVPQSMAYAQLAGLPAYYGLYASFLPGIVAPIAMLVLEAIRVNPFGPLSIF